METWGRGDVETWGHGYDTIRIRYDKGTVRYDTIAITIRYDTIRYDNATTRYDAIALSRSSLAPAVNLTGERVGRAFGVALRIQSVSAYQRARGTLPGDVVKHDSS